MRVLRTWWWFCHVSLEPSTCFHVFRVLVRCGTLRSRMRSLSPSLRWFVSSFFPKHGVVRLPSTVKMARKWRRTSCNVDGTSLCVCVCVCGWVWHQVKGRRAILVPSLLDPIVQSTGKERKGEGATVHRRWIRLWVRRDPRQVEDGTRSTTIQKEKKEDRRG